MNYLTIDLIQYWSAAKLLLLGQNPYDIQNLLALQTNEINQFFGNHNIVDRQIIVKQLPILLWNPPVIFLFIVCFQSLSFENLILIWFILSVLILAFSVILISKHFLNDNSRYLLYLVAALFYPFSLSLSYGQITPIFTLALILFFINYFQTNENNDSIIAGIFLSVTTIKPHLFILIYLALGITAIRSKKFNTLTGFTVSLIILAIIPVLYLSNIWSLWINSLLFSPPFYWKTPTMGSWLQEFSPTEYSFVTRNIFLAITSLIVIIYFFRKKNNFISIKEFVYLIPLGLLVSPYGWVYDQMILIIPVGYILKNIVSEYSVFCFDNVKLVNFRKEALPKIVLFLILFILSYHFFPINYGQEYNVISPMILLITLMITCNSCKDFTLKGS